MTTPSRRGAEAAGREAEGRAGGTAVGEFALYPGMAAAAPGLGRAFAADPAAARVLDEFGRASGADVTRLVTDATEAELFGDRAWELAVVATEIAALEAFRAAGGRVSCALGFSIGAYAALYDAGMLDVGQIVAMIDCVLAASRSLPGRYGMAAVTGPSREAVEALCRQGEVEVAAVLGEGQVLVAGERSATDRLCAEVSARAISVGQLPVRWPLHTSLMAPVAAELERSRQTFGRLRPLRHPVYSGVDGSVVRRAPEGWELLVRHLVLPQRLDLALQAALAAGERRFVEIGPGSTLSRALRRLAGPAVSVRPFPPRADRWRKGAGKC